MQTPRRKLKGVAKDLSIITVALAHDLCEPPVVEVFFKVLETPRYYVVQVTKP